MQRVEKHIIKKDENIDNLCFLSKNLYNTTNFILRQNFLKNFENIKEYESIINEKGFIDEYSLTKKMAEINQKDYRSLPIQTSQQIVKLVYKNWKSFFKSLKDYQKNPKKYLGKPKLPKYKDKIKGRNIVIFPSQNCKLKENYIYLPKMININPIKTKINNFNQVRIVPKTNCYVIEIIYKKEKIKHELDQNKFIGIDLGINNLCAITSNQTDIQSFLINGRIIKSINQYFNKTKAKYQSILETNKDTKDRKTSKRIERITQYRNNYVEDIIHKSTRYIINFCIKNHISTIIIGKNIGWKDESNIGKKNNQNFVMIPHAKFIDILTYKAEEVGIKIVCNEESYTSKCDSLALESLEHHEKYIGKRVKRGLFKSSTGKKINADINGSINILRKVIGDSFVKDLSNSGQGLRPRMINVSLNKKVKKTIEILN